MNRPFHALGQNLSHCEMGNVCKQGRFRSSDFENLVLSRDARLHIFWVPVHHGMLSSMNLAVMRTGNELDKSKLKSLKN